MNQMSWGAVAMLVITGILLPTGDSFCDMFTIWKLSASIYDLALLDVCHFNHHLLQ